MQQMMLGGGTKYLSFRDSYISSGGITTTYTFTAADIGPAAGVRRVIVGLGGFDNTSIGAITSVTIGGVSATQIATATNGNSSADLWIALVPTGAIGDVVVNFNSDLDEIYLGVWAAYGLSSNTPIDSGTSIADPLTDTLATSGGGFCIAVATGQFVTWTNVTERYAESNATVSEGADALTTGANISPSGDVASAVAAAVFATF